MKNISLTALVAALIASCANPSVAMDLGDGPAGAGAPAATTVIPPAPPSGTLPTSKQISSVYAGYVAKFLGNVIPDTTPASANSAGASATAAPTEDVDIDALSSDLSVILKDGRFSAIVGELKGSHESQRATAAVLLNVPVWKEEWKKVVQQVERMTTDRLLQGALKRFNLASLQNIEELMTGMDEYGKISLIQAFISVPQDRLTPTFWAAAKDLTTDVLRHSKSHVIKALGSVSAEFLESVLEAAESLTPETRNEYFKFSVIQALARIPAKRLNNFVAGAQSLMTKSMMSLMISKNMTQAQKREIEVKNTGAEGNRVSLIQALARIPAERLTPTFWATVKSLTADVNGDHKPGVIEAVGSVEENCLDRVLEAARRLKLEISRIQRSRVIQALGKIPPERLDSILEAAMIAAEGQTGEDRVNAVLGVLFKA